MVINVIETKKSIMKVFINFLIYRDVPHFIGGSIRFGWETFLSDIDIFACMDCCGININELRCFPCVENKLGAYTDGVDHQYSLLGGVIHLSVFETKNMASFRRLEEEHKLVESFLKTKPNLLQMMKEIKYNGNVKGKVLYRAILGNMGKF